MTYEEQEELLDEIWGAAHRLIRGDCAPIKFQVRTILNATEAALGEVSAMMEATGEG